MPLLELKSVSVGYGRNRVLQNVDLTLERGEIVTLLGANGAGKSTLAKTISGLLRAEAGLILLDGESIGAMSPAERLRRGVAGESFAVDGDRLQVTVSIGVAARRVQHTDPSDLLRFADRALYAAKANGRNCVVADTGREWGD